MSASPVVTALNRAFQAFTDAVLEPVWLTRRREAAMARFTELGLPARNEEAWRFTSLRALTPDYAAAVAGEGGFENVGLATHRMAGEAHRIVVVNGTVRPELSPIGALPDGVWLGSLADAIDLRPDLAAASFDQAEERDAQPFTAVNAALSSDGFVLAVDPGVVLVKPVEVIYLGDGPVPCSCHVRSTIHLGAGSQVTVIETFAGPAERWTNAVTVVDLAAGAALRHVRIQADDPTAIHIAATRARLAETARYDAFVLITGARLSRQDIQVSMAGAGASLTLNGAWLLRGEQEATVAPAVDHQAPGGETNELLKGVLADSAHGVFLGSVLVREGADGTNARQMNRNLLTSPTARIDTRPELTIHADEVKCGHGATVGDLDEAALFYLQSRGIDPATARHMLIEAFVAEVLDAAALPPEIDAHARRYMSAWLQTGGQRT